VNVHLVDYEGDNPTTDEDEVTDLADGNGDADRSLYKTGAGSAWGDFTFVSTVGSSPGALNDGQWLLAPVSGAMDDPDGTESSAAPGASSPSGPVVALSITPHPVRGAAELVFETSERALVHVSIHDVAGRLVRRWSAGHLRAGLHRLAWDGPWDGSHRRHPGVYDCRITADGVLVGRRKVVVLP
jgi:hypothetical protein